MPSDRDVRFPAPSTDAAAPARGVPVVENKSAYDSKPVVAVPAERLSNYAVVLLLIAANAAAFAYELSQGADFMAPTARKLIELGANSPPLTRSGESWRLVSAMFLHYGAIHIGLNMLCLWGGRIVEPLYGHLGFASLYWISGILGSAASLARDAILAPSNHAASAGASGAVFGVYGAFGAYLLMRRGSMGKAAWTRTVRDLGSFLGINLLYGITIPGIDVAAHVGGLAGGFGAGACLLVGRRSGPSRPVVAIALALATTAIVFGALALTRTDVRPIVQ